MYELTKLANVAYPKIYYYLISETGGFHTPSLLLHEHEMDHLVDAYNRMNSDLSAPPVRHQTQTDKSIKSGVSCPHCGYIQAKAVVKEHPLSHDCNRCRKKFSAQRINGVIVTAKL